MSVEVKRTKKELESLSRELGDITSSEFMNAIYVRALRDGSIKGRKVKSFWRKSIMRLTLNHFNSTGERYRFCLSLMKTLLTEESIERIEKG
jgi:hypothetical protein